MSNRKRSREYLLNRIIFAQVILLCVLTTVLIVRTKEPVSEAKQSTTPTIAIGQNSETNEGKESDPSAITDQIVNDQDIVNQTEGLLNQAEGLTGKTEGLQDQAEGLQDQTKEITNQSNDVQNQSQVAMSQASIPSFASGMSQDFINTLSNTQEGTLLKKSGVRDTIYYSQTDSRWAQEYYGGKDTIGEFGCGPTSLAIVISSLTETKIDPVQMCAWAFEKDYWYLKSGSKHNLIPEAAAIFGLKVQGVENSPEAEGKLRTALENGNMVIALMGKGSFTGSGHFVVFYGMNEDGLVYVADPASEENTNKTWELSLLVREAKVWAAAKGPFWIISQ